MFFFFFMLRDGWLHVYHSCTPSTTVRVTRHVIGPRLLCTRRDGSHWKITRSAAAAATVVGLFGGGTARARARSGNGVYIITYVRTRRAAPDTHTQLPVTRTHAVHKRARIRRRNAEYYT